MSHLNGAAHVFRPSVRITLRFNMVLFSSSLFLSQVVSGEPQQVVFTIPIFEPMPSQYYIRAVSDRWLGSEAVCIINFQHLILPERHPPHTGVYRIDAEIHRSLNRTVNVDSQFSPVWRLFFIINDWNNFILIYAGLYRAPGPSATAPDSVGQQGVWESVQVHPLQSHSDADLPHTLPHWHQRVARSTNRLRKNHRSRDGYLQSFQQIPYREGLCFLYCQFLSFCPPSVFRGVSVSELLALLDTVDEKGYEACRHRLISHWNYERDRSRSRMSNLIATLFANC